MVRNKFLILIVSTVLFVIMCVPVSASSYTVYSTSPMSDSYRQLFEDLVINLRSNSEVLDELGCDDFDYCYFRSSDYGYTLLICPEGELAADNVAYPSELSFGGPVYFEYIVSYGSGYSSVYSISVSKKSDSFTVTNADCFVYSDVSGIGSNDIAELEYFEQIDEVVINILYTILVFLLLFVAFKFLNKRWLLP